MINKKTSFKHYLLLTALCVSQPISAENTAKEADEALSLSVEDLLNVEVTSVAKKAQSLNDAPAAAFVISNEDIKRSGATSIPEALRLAPGLDVARIDANKWAVSSRGFNGRFANKLLVLIDGRNAYTRSFSGVLWENQDVMMEDIDRIEVIRGSGATLWGANAMNGVINIITKHSSKTQGALLTVGGGTQEQDFGSFRYGTKFGEDTTARAYVKGFNRANNSTLSGGSADDSWSKVQSGFRVDSQWNNQDNLTFQGTVYQDNINQSSRYPQMARPFITTQQDKINAYGGNVMARLQHTFSTSSDYSLQVYYDTYTRTEAVYTDSRNTLDVDFQHHFSLFDWHEIIWGLNYRFGHDFFVGNPIQNGSTIFTTGRTHVNDQVFSSFIQDELTLIDDKLLLTLGSKFEHNDYSGFEIQPSATLMWMPYNQQRFWGGVSRAVRTPSRFEKNFDFLSRVVPLPSRPSQSLAVVVQSNPNYQSEEVINYELGYRTTFTKAASLDVTGFYNNYRHLRYPLEGKPFFDGTKFVQPYQFINTLQAKTYGVEIAAVWQMLDWWRWDANYSWLHTQFNDLTNIRTGISPQQRVSLRAALSPSRDIDLDFWFRYVDSNTSVVTFGDTGIKGYVTLDLRLAWHPLTDIEFSLVGQNLLAQKHLEYIAEIQTLPTVIERGFYGKISWKF